jgi:hypothetical protein
MISTIYRQQTTLISTYWWQSLHQAHPLVMGQLMEVNEVRKSKEQWSCKDCSSTRYALSPQDAGTHVSSLAEHYITAIILLSFKGHFCSKDSLGYRVPVAA